MAERDDLRAQVDSIMGEMKEEREKREQAEAKELEKERAKQAYERKRAMFQEKKMELAEQVAEFEEQDNPMASMMMTMLDVVIQMESTINMINGVNVAFDCISQALGCIDGLIDFNQGIFAESLTHNYGFFARLKRKREQRKAIRNNASRIKQVCDNIQATLDMAQDMSASMSELSTRVAIMMNKSAVKQEKRRKKQLKNAGITAPTVQGSAAARALVDGVKARKAGGDDAPTSSFSGASSVTPTSASSSGDSSDIIF